MRVLCIPLPLDVQGGIEGGLALVVRFDIDAAPHLAPDFSETFAKPSRLDINGGGICKTLMDTI